MSLKTIALFGALAVAAPAAAFAGPAGGLTAQASAPVTASAIDTNVAVTPGTTAKVEKIWWRGGYGWRGYGFRRFGYGYGYGYRPFFRGYYGYGRPFWHRRGFYY